MSTWGPRHQFDWTIPDAAAAIQTVEPKAMDWFRALPIDRHSKVCRTCHHSDLRMLVVRCGKRLEYRFRVFLCRVCGHEWKTSKAGQRDGDSA